MTFADFEAAAKAKIKWLAGVVETALATHPELAATVEGDAEAGVADAKTFAETEVERLAPAEAPTADFILDQAAKAIDNKLTSDIAALTSTADAQKAALASVRGVLQPQGV